MDAPKKKKAKPPRSGEQRKDKRRMTRSAATGPALPPAPAPQVPAGSLPLVSVPVMGSAGHVGAGPQSALGPSGLPGAPAMAMGMPMPSHLGAGTLSSHAAQLATAAGIAGMYPDPQAAGAVTTAKMKASAKQKDAAKSVGKKRPSYISEIKDMMYTFGDSRDTCEETAQLIEGITRSHVLDLLRRANQNAARRGTRVGTEDIIFQIKRDPPKMARLKEFLSWKEIRKRARTTTEKATDDPLNLEDVKSDARPRKFLIRLPWDFASSLKPLADQHKEDSDGETREIDAQNKQRLRVADEITRVMTREQYLEYSECRQASFTYKKAKKFREWVGMPMSDDLIEVLGYLAWEVVGLITQTALEVKHQQDRHADAPADATAAAATPGDAPAATSAPGGNETDERTEYASTIQGGLFTSKLSLGRTVVAPDQRGQPLQPAHVREAMRRLRALDHHPADWSLLRGALHP